MTKGELLDVLGTMDSRLMTVQWLAEGAVNRLGTEHSKVVCQESIGLISVLRAILQNERMNVAEQIAKGDK